MTDAPPRRPVGRPPISRDLAFQEIVGLRRVGRGQIQANQRLLGLKLGCHRRTAGVILADLEAADRIRRIKRKGRRGLLIQVPVGPPGSTGFVASDRHRALKKARVAEQSKEEGVQLSGQESH